MFYMANSVGALRCEHKKFWECPFPSLSTVVLWERVSFTPCFSACQEFSRPALSTPQTISTKWEESQCIDTHWQASKAAKEPLHFGCQSQLLFCMTPVDTLFWDFLKGAHWCPLSPTAVRAEERVPQWHSESQKPVILFPCLLLKKISQVP